MKKTELKVEVKYNEIILIKEEGQENAKSYYKGILRNDYGYEEIVLIPIQRTFLKEIHKSHMATYYEVKQNEKN